MITIMPDWYSEAENELDRAIFKIAERYNLKFCFVRDSKTIDNAKDMILQAMVSIYQNSSGQFTQEELKDFKAIEEAMEKERQKPRQKIAKNSERKKFIK